jgi:two-component system KDP operon response regulator KdpE
VVEPGPVVLLIEDEPQMRRFLRAALENEAYRLVEAPTAREGLAQAAGRNPDIILLDLGLPDDYLTKPFGVGELLARMRVALRHAARAAGAPDQPVFTSGDLRVDLEQRRVLVDEREVHLTPTEYRLLVALVRHAGKVLTHRHLLREVWGANTVTQTPALRVHMTQLRHKLERDPTQPRHLLTEPGVGYRLRAD